MIYVYVGAGEGVMGRQKTAAVSTNKSATEIIVTWVTYVVYLFYVIGLVIDCLHIKKYSLYVKYTDVLPRYNLLMFL